MLQTDWGGKPYHSLDYELKKQFGKKIYKISLDGGMTCPNRDGTLGTGGCIFCSAGGSGDFAEKRASSLKEQMDLAKNRVRRKISGNDNSYIAYFQSYTNTYAPLPYLEQLFTEAVSFPEICGLSIGTRPDCLPDGTVKLLAELNRKKPVWVELRQRYSFGYDYVAVAPGNYGLDFMKESYGYDLDRSVKCSNFIGETIDMAADMGFKRMLLTGHIGKLIKVAGGIMNTHSREADCRIELLTAFAFKCGVAPEYIKRIMDSLTTEEALAALKESGRLYEVMDYAMERICFYLDKRAKGRLEIDCIMYSNEFGELAKSRKAEKWFTLLAQEQAQQI